MMTFQIRIPEMTTSVFILPKNDDLRNIFDQDGGRRVMSFRGVIYIYYALIRQLKSILVKNSRYPKNILNACINLSTAFFHVLQNSKLSFFVMSN